MGNGGPRKKKLCGARVGDGDEWRLQIRDGSYSVKGPEAVPTVVWRKLMRSSGDGRGWWSGGGGRNILQSYDDEVSARTVL